MKTPIKFSTAVRAKSRLSKDECYVCGGKATKEAFCLAHDGVPITISCCEKKACIKQAIRFSQQYEIPPTMAEVIRHRANQSLMLLGEAVARHSSGKFLDIFRPILRSR